MRDLLLAANKLKVQNICFKMQDDSATVSSTQNDEVLKKLGFCGRGKKNVRKITTFIQLLRCICASQEKCIEWLKYKGLIPRVLFCPRCNSRMKFEANYEALDGYIWICKECTVDPPPQLSARHGSWLESRDYPLKFVLLYTYLWAHGFTLDQICKETNLPLSIVEEWNSLYCTICHSLYQKNAPRGDDRVDGNNLDKESAAAVWKKKNQSKDPFLQFLRDADSL